MIQHDTYAFEELYDRHWGVLYSFARKLLKDDDEAKDVIQDIFTKLYERLGTLQIETSIFSYLYQTVRNSVLDIAKHQKVRIEFIDTFKDFYTRGEFLTDNQVRENELARLIEQEIENLPHKMRAIFEMSRKQYLTHKQIAQASGVSEGTVKKQLHYAINKLRSRLSSLFFLQLMSAILWINRMF
ncbi:RNA polymerase sigma factor [Chitinophaga sp. CF118]|uniref:RNA polymerase sigma factor n=1 Tax=Chitinophaga sp. CF118 TaxID=1884367 RepID=UPI0015A6A80D|nr:RNA polymerase sigma-70 factor [Chitinophaga sp. CF118]